MKSHRSKKQLSGLLAIVTALALLAGCQAPTPPPPDPEPTAPAVRPTATKPAAGEGYYCVSADNVTLPVKAETGSHSVLNQLILAGTASAIEEVMAKATDRFGEFTLLQTCYLNRVLAEPPKAERQGDERPIRGWSDRDEFTTDQRQNLVTQLYQTPDGSPFREIIPFVNEVGNELSVYADPNYLTGPLQQEANPISPCAVRQEPFEIGGSPFEIGGSPFEIGGSSSGGHGAMADPDIFWKQWAFRDIALERTERDNWGEGVTVAIFDTSPYSEAQPSPVTIRDDNVDLELHLTFPEMVNVLSPTWLQAPTDTLTTTLPITVADHGLFAAGLVEAVAPESTIHLVRVLNDYGCGDLWTLNDAINSFVDQHTKGDRQSNRLVLNLSLGVLQPRDFDKAQWPAEIVTLEQALLNAHGRGAVIVAASGNESYATEDPPRPMAIPAGWPIVIGVAASNQAGGFACYSNDGYVLAPGADGREATEEACQPRADECKFDNAGCPVGIVSLASEHNERDRPAYRFWVGTSFAAPLVSGQAAALLSNGIAAADVKPCILNTATPGDGGSIVNVPGSIAACSSATSQRTGSWPADRTDERRSELQIRVHP